jgi:hypothetical protein
VYETKLKADNASSHCLLFPRQLVAESLTMSCSRTVFPVQVIKSVASEIEDTSEDDPVPSSMNLSPTMTSARLGDSTVSSRTHTVT